MAALRRAWILLCCGLSPAQDWQAPARGGIHLPPRRDEPQVVCNQVELGRLRRALESEGPERNVVEAVLLRARRLLGKTIRFPPRGGQHNQWYQCDACQLGLETLAETRHRCPRCEQVYSGEPYDDVVYSRLHHRNLSGMRDSAWAWALTGKEEFAAHARRVLLGYAERYLKYPYHNNSRKRLSLRITSGGHILEQTLSEASLFVRSVGPAYDLVHGFLETLERKKIETGLLLPMLRNLDKCRRGKSNWQSWHNAAMLMGGILLRDEKWVEKALFQKQNGFLYQMQACVDGNGMWYENSWGYHFYTLQALTALVESCRHVGIDLWGHPRLLRMFTLPARYTLPGSHLPRFGDSVDMKISMGARLFEQAHAATKAKSLAGLLALVPNWTSVMLGRPQLGEVERARRESLLVEGSGHAILRSGPVKGLVAVLTYGAFGGFHGHFDKLSFVFYGLGYELGVDPGRARSQAYRLPIHKNWYRATVAHNTVVVDGRSQAGSKGELLFFTVEEGLSAVAVRCQKAYPGVVHSRFLILLEDALLVLDHLVAKKERRFDWLYHNRGQGVECESIREKVQWPEPYQGKEFIRAGKMAKVNEDIAACFAGSETDTWLRMAAAGQSQVITGDGPLASILDRVPLVSVSRRGRRVSFVAILEPVPKGERPGITGLSHQLKGGRHLITIGRGGEQEQLSCGWAKPFLRRLRKGRR